jgi:rRNA maturation endonuclease Nob1
MVLEKITGIIQPDTTYTYECYDCGEEFESEAPRDRAECPKCGGPPVVPDEA